MKFCPTFLVQCHYLTSNTIHKIVALLYPTFNPLSIDRKWLGEISFARTVQLVCLILIKVEYFCRKT